MSSFRVDSEASLLRYSEIIDTIEELFWEYNVPISRFSNNLIYFNLNCRQTYQFSLPPLPQSLQTLVLIDIPYNILPTLPDGLKKLNCSHNQLGSLMALPSSLVSLNCSENLLNRLPPLPINLEFLNCSFNLLRTLPEFPDSLSILNCSNNRLTSLSRLPENLIELDCSNNRLTSLPPLSENLIELRCGNNNLITSQDDIIPENDDVFDLVSFEEEDFDDISSFEEEDFDEPEPYVPDRNYEYSEPVPELREEKRREIDDTNRRLEENRLRAIMSSVPSSSMVEFDHGFDITQVCQSSEDLLGNKFAELEKIIIIRMDGKIFCFSGEELLGSLNSKNLQGRAFTYYSSGRETNMYKLPIYGFVDQKVYEYINEGEETLDLTFVQEVNIGFQNRVRLYTGDIVSRRELFREI